MKFKIFIGILVFISILLSFLSFFIINNSYKNKIGVIEIKENHFARKDEFTKIPYLNYDKIFAKSSKEVKKDGIYSDITSDGKINWSKNQIFNEAPKLELLIKEITLNGKNISLPTRFDKLDINYVNFDDIDVSKIDFQKMPLHYKNSNNSYFLEIMTNSPMNIIYDKYKYPVNAYGCSLGKDNDYMLNIFFITKDNKKKITALQTSLDAKIQTTYELKIANIGIGNTFNEMYDVFGTPTEINAYDGKKIVNYIYSDTKNKKSYNIFFEYMPNVANAKEKTYSFTHNNVISTVHIVCVNIDDIVNWLK